MSVFFAHRVKCCRVRQSFTLPRWKLTLAICRSADPFSAIRISYVARLWLTHWTSSLTKKISDVPDNPSRPCWPRAEVPTLLPLLIAETPSKFGVN